MYDFMCNRYLLKHKDLLKETTKDILYMDEDMFNCGGFALGLDEWYLPYDDELDERCDDVRDDYYPNDDELCDDLANLYIEFMTREHDWIREIFDESELKENEYLVVFKASIYDFHYARRLSNGQWYHKLGTQPVRPVSEDRIYDDEWWYGMPCSYAGRLRFLAVKKLDMSVFRNNRRLRQHTTPHYYFDKLSLNFRKEVA